MIGPLLYSSSFLIFVNYFMDKKHFEKNIPCLRDQYPSNFNSLDYEQSLSAHGYSRIEENEEASEHENRLRPRNVTRVSSR